METSFQKVQKETSVAELMNMSYPQTFEMIDVTQKGKDDKGKRINSNINFYLTIIIMSCR